jgi:hypothetical protein
MLVDWAKAHMMANVHACGLTVSVLTAGVKYVPQRIYELRAGQKLPAGAVVVNPSAFQPIAAAHAAASRHRKTGLEVAKAFPVASPSNIQNGGNYGHLSEEILTTHSGPVRVAGGSFKSHLRGAAPAVSAQAAPRLQSKRAKRMHMQAREFAEALDDCRGDAQDDCQTELHLHDSHLKAFEDNHDMADKGLFRIFESAQNIPDANGHREAPTGMLAQMPSMPSFVGSGRVDGFGIPEGGSLPGDDV